MEVERADSPEESARRVRSAVEGLTKVRLDGWRILRATREERSHFDAKGFGQPLRSGDQPPNGVRRFRVTLTVDNLISPMLKTYRLEQRGYTAELTILKTAREQVASLPRRSLPGRV